MLIDGLVSKDVPGAPVDRPMPVRVYVYERNIERLCGGVEMLEDEITWQISEEIKFKLGMPTDADDPARTTPARADDEESPGPRRIRKSQ